VFELWIFELLEILAIANEQVKWGQKRTAICRERKAGSAANGRKGGSELNGMESGSVILGPEIAVAGSAVVEGVGSA